MTNTLGLDDELDPIETVSNLEIAFSIRFTEPEVSAWRTVGDIFSTLRSHLSNSGKGAGRCGTTITFHRLRRSVSHLRVGTRLRPDTPVKGITNLTTKALFKQVSADL